MCPPPPCLPPLFSHQPNKMRVNVFDNISYYTRRPKRITYILFYKAIYSSATTDGIPGSRNAIRSVKIRWLVALLTTDEEDSDIYVCLFCENTLLYEESHYNAVRQHPNSFQLTPKWATHKSKQILLTKAKPVYGIITIHYKNARSTASLSKTQHYSAG